MYVYVMKTEHRCKIGKARDPKRRLAELQTGCPTKIELLAAIKCKSDRHALQIEKVAHQAFKAESRRGEWFTYSGNIQRFVATIKNGVESQERAAESHRRLDAEFFKAMQEG